jgi:phage shock protein C
VGGLTSCGNGVNVPVMPLQRSRTTKMIAGVCGGIAEWLGWDPTVVRVGYVLISILSAAFPGMLVYLVLWVVMPKAPRQRSARHAS